MGLRVDARPFSLEGREYVRQVIRDFSPEIVIPKAAQMAFTITFLTRSLHSVVERKWNGMYLLPLKTGAVPFVQARIDPIIESNAYLDAKFASVDNRLHKQTTDRVNLYIRGTNISSEVQEVPVDFEIWDERDRMVEENLEDARHRMDGSQVKKLVQLSTPTVDGHGVYSDDAWPLSDQHRWEIACPACGRYQCLNFDDKELDYTNLKLGDTADECVLECAYCKYAFTDLERKTANATGRWVAANPNGLLRGYFINQFNSPTQSLWEIMRGYYAGQTDQRKLKAFWQQNMGRPYSAPGDRITVELLDKCRLRGYSLGGIPTSSIHLGIDVGNVIHVWAYMQDRQKRNYVWQVKLFREWSQLDKFLGSLISFVGVIDAHPEKSKARELCMKYHGKLFMGFEQDRDQQGEIATWDNVKPRQVPEVKIDRTLAFDTVISHMMNGATVLPANARELGEAMPMKPWNGLYHHLIQQVRVEEENTKGQLIARWKRNKNPDHWHHAMMFATVALLKNAPLQVPAGFSKAVGGRSLVGA
jgi:hypothetical protein